MCRRSADASRVVLSGDDRAWSVRGGVRVPSKQRVGGNCRRRRLRRRLLCVGARHGRDRDAAAAASRAALAPPGRDGGHVPAWRRRRRCGRPRLPRRVTHIRATVPCGRVFTQYPSFASCFCRRPTAVPSPPTGRASVPLLSRKTAYCKTTVFHDTMLLPSIRRDPRARFFPPPSFVVSFLFPFFYQSVFSSKLYFVSTWVFARTVRRTNVFSQDLLRISNHSVTIRYSAYPAAFIIFGQIPNIYKLFDRIPNT